MRAVLLVFLLLLAPAAQACEITPIVSMKFPDRQPCGVDLATGEIQGCEPLMELGTSRTYQGEVHYEWDVDQCSAEGGVLQGDMVFTFDVSRLNPAWMPITFEPPQVTVTPADYYGRQPTHDPDAGRTYGAGTAPFEVTFTFERMPNEKELQALDDRDGAARFFLKVLAQGEGTNDAFGISQFTFDARPLLAPAAPPVDEEAPMFPISLGLVALGLMAAMRRR